MDAPAPTSLAQAAPTEVVWRVETAWPFAPWLTGAGVASIVALIAYCYAREVSPAGRAYRWLLGGLRLTTFALLLVMLSELLLAGARSGTPRFVVLVDNSPSMGVEDSPTESSAPRSRLAGARAVLAGDGGSLIDNLAAEYAVSVRAVAGGEAELSPAEGEDWRAVLAGLAIAPADQLSRTGDAIERAVAATDQPPPQGVLVVTDGRVTAGRPLEAAAETARRVGVPLYFVGVGNNDEPPDVSVGEVLAEEVVFVDDLVGFRATVRTSSSMAGPIRVVLRRQSEKDGAGAPVLDEQTIQAPDGGGSTPVQLTHRPLRPGVYRYVIEAIALSSTLQGSGGELNTANNARAVRLTVRDQRVRVLLASDGPSYEYRYLKSLLERDDTVTLASFLQQADREYATADPTALTRLPLRLEELDRYDALVLMDLDPRLAPRSLWSSVKRLVGEKGGGLALVAGPRNLPRAYRDLPAFADLYPADLGSAGVGEMVAGSGFRVTPTPVGLRQAALQMADDTPSSASVWRNLAPLYWYVELGKPKPAAQVLAQHPTARSSTGGPVPLVVSQYFGAGQVLAHGVDATYRWRLRVGDAYFARYWVQTLRTLARGRLNEAGGPRLTVDRREYKPGEPVRLRLRRPAGTPAGGSLTAVVQSENGPERRVELVAADDARGVYRATLDRLPVGDYRALLADAPAGPPGAQRADRAVAEWRVAPPPGELARVSMAEQQMRSAAARSGGRFLRPDDAAGLVEDLPPPRRPPLDSLPPLELWNRWWMIAAVCGCLVTEWVLRKRKSML